MGKVVNINRMEIFRAGRWNGMDFTEEDLYSMERNFNLLQNMLRPKLKITHREDQESLAGLASYGDIVNVFTDKLDGQVILYCNIERVPEEVADWIRTGRFAERSIELWLVKEIEGTVYRNVITAVSLLGSEIPAVSGLAPVHAKDKDGHKVVDISNAGKLAEGMAALSFSLKANELKFESTGDENKSKKGGDNMTIEQQLAKMQEQVATLEKANKELEIKMKDQAHAGEVGKLKETLEANTAQIEQLKEFKAQAETLRDENKKLKDANAKAEQEKAESAKTIFAAKVDALLKKFKTAGRIVPAVEDKCRELLMSLSDSATGAKFSEEVEGKKLEVAYTQFALLESIFENLPKVVDFNEVGGEGEDDDDLDGEGTESEGAQKRFKHGTETYAVKNQSLSDLAKKIMTRDKCTFAVALEKASKEAKTKAGK